MPPVEPQVLSEPEATNLRQYQKVIAEMFGEAVRYNNVLMGLGYGAFFALLAATKDELPTSTKALAVSLILISLISFIAFEVFKMVYVSWITIGSIKKLGIRLTPQSLENIQEHGRTSALTSTLPVCLWVLTLLLSVPTGFVAAIVLAWHFIWSLF